MEQVSATTGMPWANVRRNMAKVHGVLSRVDEVLQGLTRGLDLSVLDEGVGERDGRMVSFYPRADSLGIVLPSNSPGVHSLWAPATVLKMPLVLKPGSAEPWTPLRIIQSWIKAGLPADAFGYYPADHAGGHEILRSCGRGMVFGDVASTRRWKADPRVEVHGPGYSKFVIGPDAADDWESCLDVMVESISNNGGRSCVNASGVWVTKHGDRIAEALADRLSRVVPRAADDPDAVLAPFADPSVAERISTAIDQELLAADEAASMADRRARDLSAAARGSTCRLGRRRHLPAANRHPLRRESPPRQSRVSVPVRQRRRGRSRRPAARARAFARRHVRLERSPVPGSIRHLAARRSPEPRRHSDDADWVGSAARRESLRPSVREARDSGARCDGGGLVEHPEHHGGRRRHVLRQLPARQRAGR